MVVVVRQFVEGMYSRRWWDYIYQRERKEETNNNEAWRCTKCNNYNPFYYDRCYFCGAE